MAKLLHAVSRCSCWSFPEMDLLARCGMCNRRFSSCLLGEELMVQVSPAIPATASFSGAAAQY